MTYTLEEVIASPTLASTGRSSRWAYYEALASDPDLYYNILLDHELLVFVENVLLYDAVFVDFPVAGEVENVHEWKIKWFSQKDANQYVFSLVQTALTVERYVAFNLFSEVVVVRYREKSVDYGRVEKNTGKLEWRKFETAFFIEPSAQESAAAVWGQSAVQRVANSNKAVVRTTPTAAENMTFALLEAARDAALITGGVTAVGTLIAAGSIALGDAARRVLQMLGGQASSAASFFAGSVQTMLSQVGQAGFTLIKSGTNTAKVALSTAWNHGVEKLSEIWSYSRQLPRVFTESIQVIGATFSFVPLKSFIPTSATWTVVRQRAALYTSRIVVTSAVGGLAYAATARSLGYVGEEIKKAAGDLATSIQVGAVLGLAATAVMATTYPKKSPKERSERTSTIAYALAGIGTLTALAVLGKRKQPEATPPANETPTSIPENNKQEKQETPTSVPSNKQDTGNRERMLAGIRLVFDQFDVDGNGILTQREIAGAKDRLRSDPHANSNLLVIAEYLSQFNHDVSFNDVVALAEKIINTQKPPGGGPF